MNILVWGCGERSRYFIKNDYIRLEDIIGFVDNHSEIKTFQGKQVLRPEDALKLAEASDYILVTVKNYEANVSIFKQMQELKFPLGKVIFIYNYMRESQNHVVHEQDDMLVKGISQKLYSNVVEIERYLVFGINDTITCRYDIVDTNKIIGTGRFMQDAMYMRDYTRFRTFELAADEIQRKELPGAVAEVGVFRGDFAKLINEKFPDRKLYLFDSFESFRPEEYEKERTVENCESGFKEVFANTSVQIAMSEMKHPEKCMIRKGFFPESIQEEEIQEQFAFVSMDVDFEESTYQGLKFFYPRLVENGYIFLHDYNSHHLGGVKIAVDRYERDYSVVFKRVPISDGSGTLIIIK